MICRLVYFQIIILLIFLYGCSSSKKFTLEDYSEIDFIDNSNPIRVLLDEQRNLYTYTVDEPVYLREEKKNVALIKKGNKLVFRAEGNKVSLTIGDKTYSATYFQLRPEENNKIRLNGKSYKGTINVNAFSGSVQLVNTLRLEEYLRGVIPSEMPIGKGVDNYEALKAFAICARTYAYTHLNNKGNYDIYNDTRDQVYKGYDHENNLSTKAILETKGMMLTYNSKPAVIFYHSTCGGYTEDASNVFSVNVPYLQSIKDGEPSYCTISSKYQWQEIYPSGEMITRLRTAGLLNGLNWSLKSMVVKSRFPSGRINELVFVVADSSEEKSIPINGNQIRSIIRKADNSSILNSNWFNITFDPQIGIVLSGKGYGHGVGLCQFGSIFLSRSGKSYTDILRHYFPGTSISSFYD